jgi:hypothetical protein
MQDEEKYQTSVRLSDIFNVSLTTNYKEFKKHLERHSNNPDNTMNPVVEESKFLENIYNISDTLLNNCKELAEGCRQYGQKIQNTINAFALN